MIATASEWPGLSGDSPAVEGRAPEEEGADKDEWDRRLGASISYCSTQMPKWHVQCELPLAI